jgi:hypothetical protein
MTGSDRPHRDVSDGALMVNIAVIGALGTNLVIVVQHRVDLLKFDDFSGKNPPVWPWISAISLKALSTI